MSNILFKQFVANVSGDKEGGSFVFRSNDRALAALLRKSILEAVESVAIGSVKFHNRPIRVCDEVVAMHMAQLVIDNRELPDAKPFTVRTRVVGPCVFSTFDIPLPFAYHAHICPVEAGEELDVEITCEPGSQYDHAKWTVATAVSFTLTDDGFLFRVELSGARPIQDVVLDAFYNMPQVLKMPPTSIYTQMLIVNQASLALLEQIEDDN